MSPLIKSHGLEKHYKLGLARRNNLTLSAKRKIASSLHRKSHFKGDCVISLSTVSLKLMFSFK